MKPKIIPTVLAFNIKQFEERFKKILPITDEIQVDFMDGRFVETKSPDDQDVPSLKQYKDKIFEAHLMVKEPLRYVPYLKDKGFKRMILHFETIWPEDIELLREFMDREGVEFFLAINPETEVRKIVPYLKFVHGVLFLGVHPGKNGAPYLRNTPKRIKELVKMNTNPDLVIQVDGGMTPETVGEVISAGAHRANTGSYVMNSDNPKEALKEMQAVAETAVR